VAVLAGSVGTFFTHKHPLGAERDGATGAT
jgi:hypothetical protein